MMQMFGIYELCIVFFMMMTFIFSAVETSIISSSPIKLRALHEKGSRQAGRSLYILDNIEDAMGMVQIAINIIEISASAFIVYIMTRAFLLNETQLAIVAAVQTVVFLMFCEILPKVIARSRPELYLMFFSYPVVILMTAFKPVISFSLRFSHRLEEMLNLKSARYSFISSRDDIGLLFKMGVSQGVIDEDHHEYIREILSFNEVTAHEVMTPLIDVVSIERKQSIRHCIKLIDATRFSRIPVYEDRVDNIIGYVYYRDLMDDLQIESIDDLLIKPDFVPSTKKIHDLFHMMQEKKVPIVFVVNEFGAVDGIVTKEDIAEEIVGEIQTRDHHEEKLIHKVSPRRFILSGSLDIDFFQKRFGLRINKKGFKTVGGYLMFNFGHIPRKGEKFEINKHVFIVHEATDRSVEKVLYIPPLKKGQPYS